ncbi:response regulator [Psychrobacillus soli]|uniref:Response regulator n=1 Tax=Psychrobacillus soli TaxID=1543965 RepID=A0A544TJ26_9BACI|nr:response regulator [Psychrobacillus soli]TQR17452.1 response regulator [Psychrobacillus soli]
MLKVLVIDDDGHKTGTIRSELSNFDFLNDSDIETVQCSVAGLKALRESQFDVIILDINLPYRFGDTPDPEGGLNLLKRTMGNRKKYNLPKEVIGLTEYDSSMQLVEQYFGDNLFSLIKYDRTSLKWVEQIKNKLSYIKSIKESSQTNLYIFDVGFVCALSSPELSEVLKIEANWVKQSFEDDNLIYYIGSIFAEEQHLKVVVVAANQMGLSAAAVTTMKMINLFRPRLMIMPGIMGGVKSEVNIGDVVISDPSWDYGDGKYVVEEGKTVFKQSPLHIRLNKTLETKINLLITDRDLIMSLYDSYCEQKPSNMFDVHIGPVASGSAVVAASEKIKAIKQQHRKLLGIDMEIYGFMYAVENTNGIKPLGIGIKGVSDLSDEDKNSDYAQYAARNSVMISLELMKKFL